MRRQELEGLRAMSGLANALGERCFVAPDSAEMQVGAICNAWTWTSACAEGSTAELQPGSTPVLRGCE